MAWFWHARPKMVTTRVRKASFAPGGGGDGRERRGQSGAVASATGMAKCAPEEERPRQESGKSARGATISGLLAVR